MFPDPESLSFSKLTSTQTSDNFPRRGSGRTIQGFRAQGTKASSRWRCVVACGRVHAGRVSEGYVFVKAYLKRGPRDDAFLALGPPYI